jgi:cysteine-rich repeat protein
MVAALGQSACSDDEDGTGGTGGTGGTAGTGGTPSGGGTGGGGTGGGGQGGGGQGGGGAMNTGDDLCPGDAYNLALAGSLLLEGDTSMAADDYNPTCDDGDGPDLVYAVTFDAPGTLETSLFSFDGALDPVLYVRTGCDQGDTTQFCRNSSTMARSYRQHVSAATYYFFVDSAGGTAGKYTLSLTLEAPACGDGAVNPGEQCDDGNLQVMDGCDDSCQVEAGVSHDCSTPVTSDVFAATPLAFHGNTLGQVVTNSYQHASDPNCAALSGGGGPEHVYALTAQSTGDMRLRLGFNPTYPMPLSSDCDEDDLGARCWVRMLYVRTTCNVAASQIGCFGPGGDGDGPAFPPAGINDYVEELVVPVTAGTTYYVFVDSHWDGHAGVECGDNCAAGPYTLHVTYD